MSSKTEFFLDDELLEMTSSVTRKIHQPTKHRFNPTKDPPLKELLSLSAAGSGYAELPLVV